MCHVLLLLPLLALPVLWIWPPEIAVPVYGVAAAVSLGVYALAYRAWKAPLAHGPQTLLGAMGRVVTVSDRLLMIRVGGELWTAEAEGASLAPGDGAVVVAVEGLRLTIRKADAA